MPVTSCVGCLVGRGVGPLVCTVSVTSFVGPVVGSLSFVSCCAIIARLSRTSTDPSVDQCAHRPIHPSTHVVPRVSMSTPSDLESSLTGQAAASHGPARTFVDHSGPIFSAVCRPSCVGPSCLHRACYVLCRLSCRPWCRPSCLHRVCYVFCRPCCRLRVFCVLSRNNCAAVKHFDRSIGRPMRPSTHRFVDACRPTGFDVFHNTLLGPGQDGHDES